MSNSTFPDNARTLRKVGSNFNIADDLRRRLIMSHDAPSRERAIVAWVLSHIPMDQREEHYVLDCFGVEWHEGEMGEMRLRQKEESPLARVRENARAHVR